jgi:tRNA threonylcarbamoyladenosine biosynthesis protein TsaB
LLLLCDAASGSGFLSLSREGLYLQQAPLPLAREADSLFPSLRAMLACAGAGYGDLSALCAYVGPGSFTGVRIALAALLGIRRGAGAPILGMDGFVRLAWQARNRCGVPSPYVVLLGAGRRQAYAATLSDAFLFLEPPSLIREEDIGAYAARAGGSVVADGRLPRAALEEAGIDAVRAVPSPYAMQEAFTALRGTKAVYEGKDVAPLYIRPPDAKPQSRLTPKGTDVYSG